MRILFINRWVGYNEGGNETHIKELAVFFSDRGHKVDIMTTGNEALEPIKEKIDHIIQIPSEKRYFAYNKRALYYGAKFIIDSLLILKELLMVKRRKYDVISVHFSLEGVLARLIKLFFGIPYVMVLAGDTPLELIEGRRADGAIHISKFMNDQCEKYGFSAQIIPKGIDLKRFKPGIEVDDLRKKYKLKDNDSVLLSVCRLDPRKNLATLIKAMDIITNGENRQDIKLLLVGDGVQRQLLQDMAIRHNLKDTVHFVGSLPNNGPLIPKYYILADLFVLPTLYEGFGWVYMESMACGTPILTTNVGSNPEIVGGVGRLIEPKDPELLAKNIIELVDNPKERKDMVRRGLDKAGTYAWPDLIPKYEDFYYKVSEKKCNKVVCKAKTILYLVFDSVSIFYNFMNSTITSLITAAKSGEWESGQVGSE